MARRAAVTVRDAVPADAAALAAMFVRSRAAAMPGLREPYPEADVARWLAGVLMRQHRVRVAASGDDPVGYIGHGRDPDHGAMVFHLYLDPAWRRQGIGSSLLAEAIAAQDAPLSLFCFARNAGGRAFYETQGFRAAAFRDGAANEEGEPDILFVRDAAPRQTHPREDMP